MNLLSKLEDIINNLMLKLGGLVLSLFKKVTPHWLDQFFQRITTSFKWLMQFLIKLPKLIVHKTIHLSKSIKTKLQSYDYRSQLKSSLETYKSEKNKKASTFGATLLAPFRIMGHWFRGLSAMQGLLLLTLSSASILSGMNIVFSGKRIAKQITADRTPASTEPDDLFARPDYYKEETRHLLVTNLRLPVYFAKINEIKSVDIDFTATLSNRFGRLYLEKMEWQLRDHLILETEPIVANFSLQEEGKEVLRTKIADEINRFLQIKKVEARVEELEITYILAN